MKELYHRYQRQVQNYIDCVVGLAIFGILLTLLKGGVDLVRHGQFNWIGALQHLGWLTLGDVVSFGFIFLIDCYVARRKRRKAVDHK